MFVPTRYPLLDARELAQLEHAYERAQAMMADGIRPGWDPVFYVPADALLDRLILPDQPVAIVSIGPVHLHANLVRASAPPPPAQPRGLAPVALTLRQSAGVDFQLSVNPTAICALL